LYFSEIVDAAPRADHHSTAVAQPAIVRASLAGVRVLDALGIVAAGSVGHSLGELTALHWGGALSEAALLRIATIRGQIMAEHSQDSGAMVSIHAGPEEVETLLSADVVIAARNSPSQMVLSGPEPAIADVVARARALGLHVTRLPVSYAFHSPLVEGVVPPLAEALAGEEFQPPGRTVISTTTGKPLSRDADAAALRALLCAQVTSPVRFAEAVETLAATSDLLVEVGPGRVLSDLVAEFVQVPVVALDAGSDSLTGLLKAVGAAFVCGVPLNESPLFDDRFARPFDIDRRPRFFSNPCELAPVPEIVPSVRRTDVTKRASRVQAAPETSPPETSAITIVRQLVAERAELPVSSVRDEARVLGDLHLNSITVTAVVAECARRLSVALPVAPLEYADATIAEIARSLDELRRLGSLSPAPHDVRPPAGVDSWVRTFTVELVERPLAKRAPIGAGPWRVMARHQHPLEHALREALTDGSGGPGILVCLPPDPDERHIDLLLESARCAFAAPGPNRFVLVQHGGGAAGFARTLHLERPQIATAVVDVPDGDLRVVPWIVAEARAAAAGYTEAHYDTAGCRREPLLRVRSTGDSSLPPLPLSSDDVLLVTGGGKGIAAECALALARETGVRLVLIGRASPETDPVLALNLERFTASGVMFRYVAADVADRPALCAIVNEVAAGFGDVTAVLHAAATNVPQLLSGLDSAAFHDTLSAKVEGARNVLAAVDPARLRLFVAFGSVIARTGMPGEAHYAVANEWLVHLTERFQHAYPATKCLVIEWSVWAGTGMGERLGRVEALVGQGITPIPQEDGIAMLRRLLAQPALAVSVVVAGRLGDMPTLKLERPPLPMMRFLERPRVYYPGIELVVDVELARSTDPYLADHVFQGTMLFPAVMGLEAMAQVAAVLLGADRSVAFEGVTFDRAIVVPEDAPLTIRIAGLRRTADRVELAIRSAATDFQVDHVRAHAVVASASEEPPDSAVGIGASRTLVESNGSTLVDPDRDLYQGRLFQKGRFKRVRGYEWLTATECVARVEAMPNGTWFGRYLPADVELGDPGSRDATIHCVQACIPHATVLPVGVERVVPGRAPVEGLLWVHARERARKGPILFYDVDVTRADGTLYERWRDLRLRITDRAPFTSGEWVEPLLTAYIERRLDELIPNGSLRITLHRDAVADRSRRRDEALDRLLSRLSVAGATAVRRRPDGRPEIVGSPELGVSVAHAGALTFAVAGKNPIGCDVEPVHARTKSAWERLLGRERFTLATTVVNETRDDLGAAATRIWAAVECLSKIGAILDAPLVFASSPGDGWVLLRSGALMVATYIATLRGSDDRLAFAVLVRRDDARL
jgi:enediyne polyketide synthase